MAVRPILLYPDPILKQVAIQVEAVDEPTVAVIQDLVDTMLDSGHSVGVAAPQIGELIRFVVVDVSSMNTSRCALVRIRGMRYWHQTWRSRRTRARPRSVAISDFFI